MIANYVKIVYQVLLHLVRAGAELAEWRFISSLMLLHGAHTRLVAWETSLGARSSEVCWQNWCKQMLVKQKGYFSVVATRLVPHFTTSASAAPVACQNEKWAQCKICSFVLQHATAADQCLGDESSLLKTCTGSGFFSQVLIIFVLNVIYILKLDS